MEVATLPELQIVSDEAWEAVQTHFKTAQNNFAVGVRRGLCSRTYSSQYLLSGFLKCGLLRKQFDYRLWSRNGELGKVRMPSEPRARSL